MSDEEDEVKDNPGSFRIPERLSIVELRLDSIADCVKLLNKHILDPKEGLFAQVREIRHTIGFWPKLIGVVVTFLAIIVSVGELLRLAA